MMPPPRPHFTVNVMSRRGVTCLLACGLLLSATASAQAQGKAARIAPDFPPGAFTDSGSYRLSDLRGKLVVLYFFEPGCPRCVGSIPERNVLVKAYQDKPVKFLAVLANGTLTEASTYQAENRLTMPIYADSLGLMQKRYGFKISLQNIWQYRVIGPDGTVIDYDMTREVLDRAIAATTPEWKYKGEKYDAKLSPVLDLLEDGQYAAAMKKLRPLRSSPNKAISQSANKLYDALKEDGDKWKSEAEEATTDDPAKAYDLFSRVAAVFSGTPLGVSAEGPLKRLSANKTVSSELAARKAFNPLKDSLSKLTPAQKPAAVKRCKDISRKYPNTPTGDQAAELLKELE